ncbi:helix-turn-helix transcriptional regulator, partial [Dyadobacter sp.]|uniref:AraC family transcriptional regulator n=1 Tax=Dyadobacter sp. TaxID=1914288 RepID=UPI003F71BD10
AGREFISKSFYIWYGKFRVHSEGPVVVHSAGDRVQMLFCMQGVATYFQETASKPFVRFKPQQHNLFLLPDKNLIIQWKPGGEVEAFAISLDTQFFFENLPASHPICTHFRSGISKSLPAFMLRRNLPLTTKMVSSLFEILNCTYSGYYKSLFIKAKVIELLAFQFEQYEHLPVPDISVNLKESDKEKMHLARRILSENLDKPWSLRELAHQVGTNEFSLKKYFKEVFGKPVFGYLHDLRMETSMQMLKEPGSRVAEIAQRAGYKNATHFTAAFKKYYGILPNKIRISLLHLLHLSDVLAQLFTQAMEKTSCAEAL